MKLFDWLFKKLGDRSIPINGTGIRLDGRDSFRYMEGDHAMIIEAEIRVQGLGGYRAIYTSSIQQWLPPYENEPLTEADKTRILDNMCQFFTFTKEKYVVE